MPGVGAVHLINRVPTLRMLQVAELKRATGLAVDFQLRFGTRRDRIRLLRNGVCPPVMTVLVRTLLVACSAEQNDYERLAA